MLSRAASIAGSSQRCLRHEAPPPRCCASAWSARECAPRRSVSSTMRARRTRPRVEPRPKLIELSFLDHSLPSQPHSRKRTTDGIHSSRMAIRSESHDPAVDELRRRARRRLIGAIVLALAAAVLLPLLLENEPKPLGDDVSIQIPPIDSGKFINPLSPGTAPDSKVRSDGAVVSVPAPSVETPAAQPPAGNDPTAASRSGSAPAASGGAPAQ